MVRIIAALALLALNSAASEASLPPVRLTIVAEQTITQGFLDETIAETEAIWRDAGIAIEWRRSSDAAAATPLEVMVTLEYVAATATAGTAPLGWIRFDGVDLPAPDIHLSLGNARDLIDRTAGLHDKPDVMRDLLLARALGRALAHELGHYLLRSRAHAARGLMIGVRPSADFFAPERNRFEILPDDRKWLIAHLLCADDRSVR